MKLSGAIGTPDSKDIGAHAKLLRCATFGGFNTNAHPLKPDSACAPNTR